ncbi:MAG: inositol monophosphatase family protein [Solirubrobacterales bacterium]
MLDLDWFGAMRRAVEAQRVLFDAEPTIAGRTVYEGVGKGGDHALVLDRRCEDAVFAELEMLHEESGLDFVAVSEERGQVAFGDPASEWRVVIDPIDGSLNARRTIPSHSLSVAIASGTSMADVELAFVHEFGAGEEFTAKRGEGARLGDRPLDLDGPGWGLEVVGLESAEPARIAPVLAELDGRAYRVRVIGSIAITLAYVAAGRLDGMLSARPCRSVDAAAAQLIVTEAGGAVAFGGLALGDADLGLDARYTVRAARNEEILAEVRQAQERSPDA